jgi:ornithine cyclodeaminase/alanine dehydrogenase-like protein (mu-crystallin family)
VPDLKLLVLSARDVRELLPYGECADLVAGALAALARGEVYQPLRTVISPPAPEGSPAPGLMALMPSIRTGPIQPGPIQPGPGRPGRSGSDAVYSLKAICIFPGNPAAGKDAHQGVVLLSSPDTGEPQAVINASALTEIRTAAASVVATRLLARADASELAVIGTGVQARAHAIALAQDYAARGRPLAGIRIAGRTPGRAAPAARELTAAAGVPVVACGSAAEAVAGAGLVVTATSSATPVLERAWLAEGAHINAVGACLPHHRELDSATMATAAVFADSRESALAESGDVRLAVAEQAVPPVHIRAEIGELLSGTAPGRASDREITVFESLGLAAEDLAAAQGVYRNAARAGAGTWVDF